jgi:hypothetical protein
MSSRIGSPKRDTPRKERDPREHEWIRTGTPLTATWTCAHCNFSLRPTSKQAQRLWKPNPKRKIQTGGFYLTCIEVQVLRVHES